MSNYNNEQDASRISEMFKALSNPNRLRIFLAMTRACGPGEQNLDDEGVRRCAGDLCKSVRIAPSTLSHHIKELRRAGLIQVERKGGMTERLRDVVNRHSRRYRKGGIGSAYAADPIFDDPSIQDYNVVINELVAENGISVTPLDFYHLLAHPGDFSSDGFHPNGKEYQSMANLWFMALVP